MVTIIWVLGTLLCTAALSMTGNSLFLAIGVAVFAVGVYYEGISSKR